MKKVLYFSNIEVPYRVRVFNALANECDLTVVYERKKANIRNSEWTKSVDSRYKTEYLGGIKLKRENAFSLKILKYLFKKYDAVIIGCFNSPVQMLAILLMRIFRKKYILNIDGEVFFSNKGIKSFLKKFFLKGAEAYLAAGEKSAESLKNIAKNKPIIPYYFSSMSADELDANAKAVCRRDGKVLIVGQYLYVKGIDIALEAAKKNPNINYKFIGMGNRTEEFLNTYNGNSVSNVEFIPFLNKEDLAEEYKNCSLFVLPSRQECWGLVINEAASFGTPIVSTYGSGAAMEFLAEDYPQFLAKPNDADELFYCIELALSYDKIEDYSKFLKEKSKRYTIENGVAAIIRACNL